MIPALVVPHLNHPELLATMLRSLDVPVYTLVVVDNATRPEDSAVPVLDRLELPVDRLVLIRPGWNLGLSASVNLALKSTPDSPWWVLTNNDITFGHGDLERLANHMGTMADEPAMGMLVEFGAVGLNARCIESVGYLDENYHPIYCEDADYQWRCNLAGVNIARLESTSSHVGSACWVGDELRSTDNARSYPDNVRYHRAKWGGPPWGEVYTTPFDQGGDIRTWTLQPGRLRRQAWR